MGPNEDRPGVVAPPPVIYAVGLFGGLLLHWIWPLPIVATPAVRILGALLVVASVAWILVAFRQFAIHGTNVDPYRPTTAIIESGPYARSRNPLYLGLSGIQLGVAFAASSLWVLLLLVPVLVVMRFGVIAREERYLERKFGATYLAYKARVRRWL
jgi:protein-S-isoprenylcysteine O-methyltransferase Ste14